MIVNSYAVLLALVAVIRLGLGLTAVWVGVVGAGRAGATDRTAAEDRVYLTFLLTLVLIGLNVAAWPLLYLLLQSYVAEWPQVMCVYGVTRVGTDSLGPSRFLPGLVTFLQVAKPVGAFLGGAWFVLYLVNRRTATGPLVPRLVWWLIPVGALAVADAAAELAYLGIPKKESFPSVGCCTVGPGPGRLLPTSLTDAGGEDWLTGAYYVGSLILVAGLAAVARRPGPGRLAALVAAGVGVAAAIGLFVVEVAAPRLLGLPDHHCPYDLIPRVPEAVVPVGLHLAGFFALGWAGIAYWAGRGPGPPDRAVFTGLLRLGFWAHLAAVAMLSLELALAGSP